MNLGYVTNGFAFHRLEDCIRILADIGYQSAAITLERHHIDPLDDDWPIRARSIRGLLDECGMRCVVETGARFLLNPRKKHDPTLVSREADAAGRRIEYVCRSIDVAVELGAACVSLWSGSMDAGDTRGAAFDRLCRRMADVLAHAESHGMGLAFEPEPGMLIETMSQFERLHGALDHPLFGLTLDVGHVHCLGDGELHVHANQWRDKLWNVHIEDMRRGVHEHLMFGDGDLNVNEAVGSLASAGYQGPVHIELSRHSHDAPNAARKAFEFLSCLMP